MQIKISFAAAYDFNQYVPRPADFDPFPAPHCGEGGVPRPAPPRKNDQNRGEVAGQNIGPNLNFIS